MTSKYRNYYFILFLISFLIFFNKNIFSQSVQLAWSPSDHPNISHYGIYRSTHLDSSFELITTVPYPDTIYSDNKMQWLTHYYYVATSVDKFGNESNFSNMIDTTLDINVPVELISFSATIKDDNDVLLTWLTATETNNYGFELQRSENSPAHFHKIGFIRSEGTTTKPNHYFFVDKNLTSDEYFYRMKQIDLDGSYELSDTIQVTVGLNLTTKLHQNNPNPFNSSTIITYNLPQDCHVELTVYNVYGQKVNSLVDDFQEAGHHAVNWDGINSERKEVTSGIYYYKLTTSNGSKFRQMLLLR